jgi:hypothetical protein
MKAYNKARLANVFDPKRLNRAFGIIQHSHTRLLSDGRLDVSINGWHIATVNSCDCEDHKRGTRYCKHIIAAMLVTKAQQISSI